MFKLFHLWCRSKAIIYIFVFSIYFGEHPLFSRAISFFKMADGRNFRASYLVKVGIKGVEEKKSLEILLKDQFLDQAKLNQFCLRFPVPVLHRPFLWKVLLGKSILLLSLILFFFINKRPKGQSQLYSGRSN